MNVMRKVKFETLLLVVLCLAAFFVNNGVLPTDGAEVKTIVTGREIVENGSWLLPTMNGELRLGVPPLSGWGAAIMEWLLPDNLSAQRIPVGMMGVMWALFFFATARYLERRRGFAETATIIFITCYNVIYSGRVVNRGIYGYAFMMAAIYFLLKMLYDARYYPFPHKWRWALLSGLMMGLSFLGNGSVAFYSLLLPFMVTMSMARKPEMKGKWLPTLLLVIVALCTFGWWYIYLFSSHPDAFSEALSNEMDAWISNTRPWYYYWRFFGETGIWAFFVLASLIVPFWVKKVSTRRLYFLAVVWMLVTLIVQSLVPRKDMSDLVPMAAPCALSVACLLYYFLEKRAHGKWEKGFFYFNGYFITLVIFALPFFIHFRMTTWHLIDVGTALFVYLFLFSICIYVALSTKRGEAKGIIYGVAALFFVMECFLLGSIGGVFGNSQRKSLGILQGYDELRRLPIYYNADDQLRMELVYESRKQIHPLNLKNPQEVLKAVPCILLTQDDLNKVLPANVAKLVDTLHMGIYDDNRIPRHYEHYNLELVNRVTVLKPKSKAP
jgi:4-amino-4-deoxy-L-arabinose transferase-like glycosyltransferase